MLSWNAARLVDLASVMGGAAKVEAVAPTIAILTLGERLAVFDIVVGGVAPGTMKGVVAGAVGPGVVEVVAGVADLIVGQVGRRAVDDARGDAVVGVGVCKCLDTFEALLRDVFKVCS